MPEPNIPIIVQHFRTLLMEQKTSVFEAKKKSKAKMERILLHDCCNLRPNVKTTVAELNDWVHRADWFLLDSRAVRHVAIGLFCLGVCVYLAGEKSWIVVSGEHFCGRSYTSMCLFRSLFFILACVVNLRWLLQWILNTRF